MHPDGRPLRLAIEAALREAGSSPAEVGLVAAHGSGTAVGDVSEARALVQVFGSGDAPAVTSVKAAAGHLVGAAGALNAAVAALALATGRIPPTVGCEALDPACAVDVVTGAARDASVAQALAIARGFEGQNVALALRSLG
jgi:3-oxoacyl-[acyl-carrier-protein] synthase II